MSVLDDMLDAAEKAGQAADLATGVVGAVLSVIDAFADDQPGDMANVREKRARLRYARRRLRAIVSNADAAVKASGILED